MPFAVNISKIVMGSDKESGGRMGKQEFRRCLRGVATAAAEARARAQRRLEVSLPFMHICQHGWVTMTLNPHHLLRFTCLVSSTHGTSRAEVL